MVKKKKKQISVDIRLFLIRNIFKTFKYYFKNIWYILFTNIFFLMLINKFIKIPYSLFIVKYFSTRFYYNLAYYGVFIIMFSTMKIILYGNTVYVMKTSGTNDIKDLCGNVVKRYLPTLGTFIIYIAVVAFLTLLFVVPGVVFLFYYFFGVFLCAVGDINNKKGNELINLNGGKALARSYNLLKGNLIRFIILTLTILFITYFIDVFVMNTIRILGFTMSPLIYNIITCCIYDIIIIYGSVMFVKIEGIENDVIEEEFKNNQEEQAMMNQAAINNFGKSKK